MNFDIVHCYLIWVLSKKLKEKKKRQINFHIFQICTCRCIIAKRSYSPESLSCWIALKNRSLSLSLNIRISFRTARCSIWPSCKWHFPSADVPPCNVMIIPWHFKFSWLISGYPRSQKLILIRSNWPTTKSIFYSSKKSVFKINSNYKSQWKKKIWNKIRAKIFTPKYGHKHCKSKQS